MSEFEPGDFVQIERRSLGKFHDWRFYDPLMNESLGRYGIVKDSDANSVTVETAENDVWGWPEWMLTKIQPRELLEPQKPVEFLVGDVVSLSFSGWEAVAIVQGQLDGQIESKVARIDTDVVWLTDKYYDGDDCCWNPEYLRLISRPKKLTVADLPDCPDVKINVLPGWWRLSVMGIEHCSFNTEHEAVQAALDFCNKIADAVIAKREGA